MISNVSKQILFLSNVIQENGSISYDNLVNYFNENFLKKDAQNLQLKKEDIIHFPVDALPNFFKEKLNNIFDQQEKIINEKGSTQAFQSFLRSIILNKLDFY